ncbi:hypothetical protein FA15DRAFT_623905 [Coprinopsis marcescibilis]|uniref:F-box domain-containing protein n=1 Tax=Coprinopsis marcescibilis TaxID=230819 RepID=A0A5C3KMN6_COPMA|nr:hypothetical protein FA15DRAFT_623905 [Coprinopsis marcescibilis]
MLELPYELWCEIARCLSRSDLFLVRTLNRHMLNIARDELYKEGRIHYFEDAKTQKLLRGLRHSSTIVAPRLRSLLLRPHVFGPPMQKNHRKWALREKTEANDAHFLLRSLTSFDGLKNLDLQCCYADHYSSFRLTIPHLNVAMKTWTSTIETLRLQIPFEAYRDMDLARVTMKNLRNLTVYAFPSYLTTNHGVLERGSLGPFINNHMATLESLSVSTIHGDYIYPIDYLFKNLGFFPHLKQLNVAFHFVSPAQSSIESVEKFVNVHLGQIRNFKIEVEPPLTGSGCSFSWPQLLEQPLFKSKFSNLQSLTLGLTRAPGIKDILHCILPYKSTLTEFSLLDKSLTFAEVNALTTLFKDGPIRSLSFITRFCGPDLLTLLSSKLPELHSLSLSFDSWIGKGATDPTFDPFRPWYYSIPSFVDTFIQTIADECYAEWKLRRINIIVLQDSNGKYQMCHYVLAMALPGVISFNGIARPDWLAAAGN